jgi:hypothetical protein
MRFYFIFILRMKQFAIFIALILMGSVILSQEKDGSFSGVNKCYGKKFSVAVHLIEDSSGNTNISQAMIDADLDVLNSQFSPMCISFNVCSTYYHPNLRSDTVNLANNIKNKEISTLYHVPSAINIYYVEKIISPYQDCSYAPQGSESEPLSTPTRDAIFIQKSCSNGGKAILSSMGHYFGLYHTSDTINGVELADGSNCKTAGDLICDTPGDPFIHNTTTTDNVCNLDPPIKDINDHYYTPDFCNIMSYYSNPCDSLHFTVGQYNRMLEIIEKGRKYLW